MEYLKIEEFRKTQVPRLGANAAYREVANGNIKAIRTSPKGKWLIPVSEVTQYRKRLAANR